MYYVTWIAPGENIDGPTRLRTEVFIEEQGFVGEFDEYDAVATHICIYDENHNPIATGRLLPYQGSTYRLGRIAVAKVLRGQNLGRVVVSAIEGAIRKLGGTGVYISAQTQAAPFYQQLGYVPEGEEYLEEHCPHIAMRKKL